MLSKRFSLWIVWIGLLVSGCISIVPNAAVTVDTPTATITPTATLAESTATIQWFPDTATPPATITPLFQPTPDLRAGLADLLAEDEFTDTSLWTTTRNDLGSAAYGKNEFTLAISAEKGSLTSLRRGQYDNFWLEINTQPSLCRGADQYGLLLRAQSTQDGYRLSVNCNGQLRLDRLSNGRSLILQDWTASGQIPPGALLNSRLGVWAARDEIQIFVNGAHQFTVHDSLWSIGQIGVFARAAGATPLTITFTSLAIWQVDTKRIPSPIPSSTVTPTPTFTRQPTATSRP